MRFLFDTAIDEFVIGGYAGSGMAARKKFRDVEANAARDVAPHPTPKVV